MTNARKSAQPNLDAAWRYGQQARQQHAKRDWDDGLEAELKQGWNEAEGASELDWESAKTAVYDAWHGIERQLPDEADGAAAQAAEDAAANDQAPEVGQ